MTRRGVEASVFDAIEADNAAVVTVAVAYDVERL